MQEHESNIKTAARGPLTGIRALEWTIMQQGPVAGMMLGDMGAEVIKIEQKGTGDPGRAIRRFNGVLPPQLKGDRFWYYETFNRNKKSIAIDLAKPQGKEIIYRLIPKTDVFLQNYRKGVADRLGIGYKTLSGYNPRLVYGDASGWGKAGREAEKPAYAACAQGRSGFMFNVGQTDNPRSYGPMGLADETGGGFLAYGIMAALFARARTGKGQQVDASLFGGMIWLQQSRIAYNIEFGEESAVNGKNDRENTPNPLQNVYRCQDKKWLALSMPASDSNWHDFCNVVGLPSLESDPKFKDAQQRQEHSAALISILDKMFAGKDRDEWLRILDTKEQLVFAPVDRISDLDHDAQALANNYITEMEHPDLGNIKVVGSPVSLSRSNVGPRFAAPHYGQHTEEVLIDIGGYTWDEIGELKEAGVI